ncbi:MAG TPA: glycosyltransferase family 4 protein [Anaerolineales bacterium]|nr:glycosyltransferase family 4 protein [Anaerolineales bacterium]
MKILILSNFYPPARSGGYTQLCFEVAEALKARGHTVEILTSNHRRETAPAGERGVRRQLHLEGDLYYYQPLDFFLNWRRRQRENGAALRRAVAEFAPDVVFVWGMWALSRAVPALAEARMPGRVVYYISDYWPAAADPHAEYWNRPARRRWARPVKAFFRRLAGIVRGDGAAPGLRFERPLIVSRRVRDLLLERGVPLQDPVVVHCGTDLARFHGLEPAHPDPARLKLLYAGQMVEDKGVHTAVEALGRLVAEGWGERVSLTLIGAGHPAYEALIRDLVDRLGLGPQIVYADPVPRETFPAFLGRFDVLVFPSVYEEPFARVVQEAMAAGLVVIGTTTGGTPEILEDGVNGLAFAPGDAAALARAVLKLLETPGLAGALAAAGRRTVFERFDQVKMVNAVEAYLEEGLRS